VTAKGRLDKPEATRQNLRPRTSGREADQADHGKP
jgi:hypothetical protein